MRIRADLRGMVVHSQGRHPGQSLCSRRAPDRPWLRRSREYAPWRRGNCPRRGCRAAPSGAPYPNRSLLGEACHNCDPVAIAAQKLTHGKLGRAVESALETHPAIAAADRGGWDRARGRGLSSPAANQFARRVGFRWAAPDPTRGRPVCLPMVGRVEGGANACALGRILGRPDQGKSLQGRSWCGGSRGSVHVGPSRE